MYLYIPVMYFAAAALYYSALAAAAVLLLVVIVCRVTQFFAVFSASDSSVFFLFILLITRFVFIVRPLGSTVTCTASIYLKYIYAYILGNYGHARSQGGRKPAAAKPPLYRYSHILFPSYLSQDDKQ